MKRPSFPRIGAPSIVVIAIAVLASCAMVWLMMHPRGQPSETASAAGHTRRASGVAGAAASEPKPVPPLPGASAAGTLDRARVLAERWEPRSAPDGTSTRVRLARLGDDGPVVRLVDHYARDPSGQQIAVGTEVMRADAVVVAVPLDQPATVIAERLRHEDFHVVEPQRFDAVVSVLVPDVTLDGVPELLAALAARVPELPADPDFIRFGTQATPNDYDVVRLWGLEKIEAPAAWTVSTGRTDVVVGVIDTGIAVDHPDLVANIWSNPGEVPGNGKDDDADGYIDDINGWNFASNNAVVTDTDGHGTHVAGTIGATGNNGSGITGVNWSVKLMALRAGSGTFSDTALLNALRYAGRMRQRGVNVVAVNMSVGGLGASASFRQEVLNARDLGLLVVAAAGNLNDEAPTANNDLVPVYPASYDVDSIIAVASSNQGDSLSVFSHYGPTTVDLAAPGTSIFSTVTGGAYARYSGTSMAAPHVTGAVALVAAANPGLTGAQIRSRILGTVDPVTALGGKVATGGRLNLRRAVSPSLIPPRVAVRTGGRQVEAAVLDRPGLPLPLEAVVQAEGGITPAATLAWTTVDGPAPVAFSSGNSASTTATFPAAGRYRIRVTATAGALQERSEVVVAVGSDASATTAGLQGWWHFDDVGGTTADASGQGRVGTVLGATRSASAALGTSMSFDGLGNNVGFAAPALARLTIAGWARATGANTVTIFPRIMHTRQGLLFGGFDLDGSSLDDGNAKTLKFALDDGVSDLVWHSPPGTLQIGAWYHVAVTYDSTAPNPSPTFYINGVRQLTGTQASTASTPSVSAGAGFIGERGDGTRGWLGQLDELRLFDRVLNESEVLWISREATLQALVGGTLTAAPTADPLQRTVSFAAAAVALGETPLLDGTWSDPSGEAYFETPHGATSPVLFTTPGMHTVRFDATTGDGVHVARTVDIDVAAPAVTREGFYSGTTSTGGAWVLLVGADGEATFFGAGRRGSFQRGFIVPSWGAFDIADRSGVRVVGRIQANGTVTGAIDDGGAVLLDGTRGSGTFGTVDAAHDGVYSGWLVDSGVRAAALIDRGNIFLAIEEPGADRVGTGEISAGGAFAISSAPGTTFTGSASGGRLDAQISAGGGAARAAVLLRDGYTPARRLVNLSVRGFVGTGDAVLIPGFVISGGALPVLVRGVGPGLAGYGVPAESTVQHPGIVLRRGSAVLRENSGWDSDGHGLEIAAADALTGAFDLDPGADDSALTLALAADAYTVTVAGTDGGTGIALAEVYDARAGGEPGELVNLSGRAFVGTGDSILIGGFVVEGEAPVLVLVRAAGPALASSGVHGVLAHPALRLVRGGTELARAGAWGGTDVPAAKVEAAGRVGAFAFTAGSDDSALLLSLSPGPYTAQVFGADGGTGVALLEIYRVNGM